VLRYGTRVVRIADGRIQENAEAVAA